MSERVLCRTEKTFRPIVFLQSKQSGGVPDSDGSIADAVQLEVDVHGKGPTAEFMLQRD
jgi:hypothetical protein